MSLWNKYAGVLLLVRLEPDSPLQLLLLAFARCKTLLRDLKLILDVWVHMLCTYAQLADDEQEQQRATPITGTNKNSNDNKSEREEKNNLSTNGTCSLTLKLVGAVSNPPWDINANNLN